MSKQIRESITETFGFEPICINSALVSAQNRQRLYWCGIRQEDGTYKKCTVVATRGEIVECDEYFLISDSMVFVARAPMSGTDETYVDQYVIISGTLYMINDEQETIDPVAKPDSLDLYLSFSELKSLYGNFDE